MLQLWRAVVEWARSQFGDDFEAHIDTQEGLVVWTFLFPRARYLEILAELDKVRIVKPKGGE